MASDHRMSSSISIRARTSFTSKFRMVGVALWTFYFLALAVACQQSEPSGADIAATVVAEVKSVQTEIVATAVAEVGKAATVGVANAVFDAATQSGVPAQQSLPFSGGTPQLPIVVPSGSPSPSIGATSGMPLDAGDCSTGHPLVLVKQWGQFNNPTDIAVEPDGNLIVTDRDARTVTRYDPDGNRLQQIAARSDGEGGLNSPIAAAVDSKGNVYVADGASSHSGYHFVKKFSPDGEFILSWGSRIPNDLEYPPGTFGDIAAITVDEDDNIYVLDRLVSRVQQFDSEGEFLAEWGSRGVDPGMFNDPGDIESDGQGNIYVADTENWRIQRFTTEGQYLGKWGTFGVDPGQFLTLGPIGVDRDGCVYVVQRDSGRGINGQKFAPDGTYLRSFGTEEGDARLEHPVGMVVDNDGNVYVLDKGKVKVYQPTP